MRPALGLEGCLMLVHVRWLPSRGIESPRLECATRFAVSSSFVRFLRKVIVRLRRSVKWPGPLASTLKMWARPCSGPAGYSDTYISADSP